MLRMSVPVNCSQRLVWSGEPAEKMEEMCELLLTADEER